MRPISLYREILQRNLKDPNSLLMLGTWFILSSFNKIRDKVEISRIRTKTSRRYVKTEVNEFQMYLDPLDEGISSELLIYKRREPYSTEYLRSFLREGDLAIDIGSNIGYYVLLESKYIKNGTIYAIEPIESNFNLLKMNLDLNGAINVRTFRYAISDKREKVKMYVCDKSNWASLYEHPMEQPKAEIEVEAMTLDDFVEEEMGGVMPTFIRMDVEGGEYRIFNGMERVLENSDHLRIFLELHPFLSEEDRVFDFLDRLEDDFYLRKAFLEPPMHYYRNVRLITEIRKRLGIPPIGEIRGYEELREAIQSWPFDGYRLFLESRE